MAVFFLSSQGVPCDLVTGEERVSVDPDGKQAAHVACTVEMCSVTTPCMYLLFQNFMVQSSFNFKIQMNMWNVFFIVKKICN